MVRKCTRGIAEVAVMEVAQVGVRTRARAALAMAAASSGSTAKRRKVNNNSGGELVKLSEKTSFVDLRSRRRFVIASEINNIRRTTTTTTEEPCSSASSDQVQASCCSSNGSSELAKEDKNSKFVDLEDDDESAEVKTSTYHSCRARREMTPSSKLREESDDVESTARPMVDSRHRSSVVEKMPTELELEEFFAAAEKDVQKRFSEKYNYDIVKDTPLEGRYEWIRLKP